MFSEINILYFFPRTCGRNSESYDHDLLSEPSHSNSIILVLPLLYLFMRLKMFMFTRYEAADDSAMQFLDTILRAQRYANNGHSWQLLAAG